MHIYIYSHMHIHALMLGLSFSSRLKYTSHILQIKTTLNNSHTRPYFDCWFDDRQRNHIKKTKNLPK